MCVFVSLLIEIALTSHYVCLFALGAEIALTSHYVCLSRFGSHRVELRLGFVELGRTLKCEELQMLLMGDWPDSFFVYSDHAWSRSCSSICSSRVIGPISFCVF